MQFRSNQQKVCGTFKSPQSITVNAGSQGLLKISACLSALMALTLATLPAMAWEEKYYNPTPAPDDVVLPMPCEGAMAFRQIKVPLAKPLDDYAITVGQDGGEWGYIEQSHPAHIAGSFTVTKPEPARYYLLAKYEVTELQYQAVMADACPTPAMKTRLPQSGISWFDAVSFSDKYNVWLRKNAAGKLPKEDGVTGFLRLPTEVEWEFAARGGLAVSPAEFRDMRFPMPEGLNDYAWFAGAQSANGKLQVSGLLKPNPVGLHDILGNVDEMMFDAFRINKLDRLHGQAGGYVVRGGNYLTPQAELRTAQRQEQPYYGNDAQNKLKTTGIRLAMVATTLTSRERVQQIEKEWNKLGAQASGKTGTADKSKDPVAELNDIAAGTQDDAVKKQLEKLRGELRANIQARDEQRDQAIRASLQLGAFLCTKLKDDGKFYDFLAKHHAQNCDGAAAPSDSCKTRKEKLDEHKKVLDFMLNYYADTVVDAGLIYDKAQVEPQISVTAQQMTARSKNNLRSYLDTHWGNLAGYLKSGKVSRQEWLEACKSI